MQTHTQTLGTNALNILKEFQKKKFKKPAPKEFGVISMELPY